jgi:hypothetical protein
MIYDFMFVHMLKQSVVLLTFQEPWKTECENVGNKRPYYLFELQIK